MHLVPMHTTPCKQSPPCPGRGPRLARRSVECASFFRFLYFSVAETVPHTLEFLDAEGESKESVHETLVQSLLDSWYMTNLDEAHHVEPTHLAKRFLPPGRLADLFLAYQAYCKVHRVYQVGITTFRQVWRSGWDKVLRFRSTSAHAQCRRCQALKTKIKHADSIEMHASYCGLLLRHLEAQWLDRKVYWSLRTRSKTQQDILVGIVDGMDKSKFMFPRWRMGRALKGPTVDSVKRPTLELSAVILHGHGTYLYITEESTRLGSNWAAEIVMRSVNAAWLRCQRLGSDGLMSSAYTPTTLCPRSKTQSSVG